jgi:hypothetical protein
MACRELQPLIKKSPSFQGVMSATRYFWKGPASALANKDGDCQQSPSLLGPVFPGCHRKRVITPP